MIATTPPTVHRWSLTLCLLVAATAAPLNSHAAPQWCSGTIGETWVNGAGNVFIRSSWCNDHHMVCSLSGDWKGVAAGTCKAWLSLAEIAVAAAKPVTMMVDTTTCVDFPTYESAPAPIYLMLKQG